ncbi:hypothetical protein DFQ04_0986 [Algoriphagus boseongensis]|uniref:Uncharacterized protein n=1 Tax=Algoriphagus boseongensis TaxID=1442587 RepID=A0A4R6TAF3_9BACT|nr:hypothetical protein [Algoriphagus boseongensis]TDQ19169.1 hypothetical protein DFQ04_0986 [Algoriphagus boseongensis]
METQVPSYSLFQKLALTLAISLGYCFLLAFSSCVEDEYYIEGCPLPTEADAIGIKQVFYGPYTNQRYSTASDTVLLKDFSFNFELEFQAKERASIGSLPGRSFALSCIPTYTVRNISNISVILLEPFAGLPVGTDIGFLLETTEGKKISELRVFEGISVYFGSILKITPQNFSQLKTRTFLFLKNGSRYFIDSSSPVLKTS